MDDLTNGGGAATATAQKPAVPTTPREWLKNELGTVAYPREGAMIDAVFVRDGAREAYFDLGTFGTGVVYGAEWVNARDIIKHLNAGDSVAAKILSLDGESGFVELSLTEASRQRSWVQIQELSESGDLIKVKVAGANPGGLLVQILDLKGFLPLSQMSSEHSPKDAMKQPSVDDLKKFIGEEFTVKVINVNPKKNKLIVSERESVSVNLKELLAKYTVGDTVEGVVSGVADFGIFVRFVDNPQIEGLIHISEIDHRIVGNPKELVTMNQQLTVKIIDIKEGRVFLSLKALKADPWQTAGDSHTPGEAVKGSVYKYTAFGALINLEDGLQGSIHISEFGGLDEMKAALKPGETYTFLIDAIKAEDKRIALKLKK
jgi:ribosomal protein S1